MIIKIMFENDWWIYDNVERIRFSYERLEAENEEDFDEYYGDLRLVKPASELKPMKFVRLSWRDKSDKEMVVLFDEVAYVLNDDGKTIEKITGPRYA